MDRLQNGHFLLVNLDVPQMICCLLCHFQPIVFMNSRELLRKGLITYYKTSGITTLQKHFDLDHSTIYKKIQEEINKEGRKNVEKQSTRKRYFFSNSSTFEVFASKNPFTKNDVEQKMFMENLALLIVKNYLPLQFVENVWLKCLVLQLCFSVQFPFWKLFSNIILLELVEKTKETYVLPLLNDCSCVATNFDLWMSKGAHDVFVLVIIFLGFDWKLKHVGLGLFEAIETTWQMLARNFIDLLNAYGLRNKIIAYVKDESSNLNTLTNALKFIVKCDFRSGRKLSGNLFWSCFLQSVPIRHN